MVFVVLDGIGWYPESSKPTLCVVPWDVHRCPDGDSLDKTLVSEARKSRVWLWGGLQVHCHSGSLARPVRTSGSAVFLVRLAFRLHFSVN